MAYITKDEVKLIRNNIKKAFPVKAGWKFSIVNRDHSEVSVSIMQCPKAYGFKGHSPINHFYIDEHYGNELQREALNKIHNIVSEKHWDESDPMTDYFHCAFYISMEIGKWDKPCVAV